MLKYIKGYSEYYSEHKNINEELISDLWEKFKSFISSLFSNKLPITPPNPDTQKKTEESPLDGKHMLYLPHQQGPFGAGNLVKIANGKGILTPKSRSKLLSNIPSIDYRYNIVKIGKDKDAVVAFLSFLKDHWKTSEEEAKKNIADPQNANVKKAIESIHNKRFPQDFLETVAWIESRFNPAPSKNPTYRGLYQIGPSAWAQLKQMDPKKYKGDLAPMDPKLNAQAGNDYLAWAYDQFEKNSV